jgi:rubrerythrin
VEYTEQQKQGFKEQFAERRKRQWMVAAVVIPLMILAVLSEGRAEFLGMRQEVLFGVFAVGIVGAIAFSLKNWRCPACHSYLGKNASPSFCPKCGVALK